MFLGWIVACTYGLYCVTVFILIVHTCRIQQCQLCGIGMLGLSPEFIKILDEEMDETLDDIL